MPEFLLSHIVDMLKDLNENTKGTGLYRTKVGSSIIRKVRYETLKAATLRKFKFYDFKHAAKAAEDWIWVLYRYFSYIIL